MIVAITGANGFIGTHLRRRFEEAGWAVRAVVRGDFEQHRLDERFAGADVVVHAAGATRAPDRATLERSNVQLTQEAVSAARAAGVRRLIHLSSQAAAGPAKRLESPVRESDAPAPIDDYGRSKLAGERVVTGESALAPIILRPSAVYGPHDRDFLTLFRLASRGVAVHPGNRSQWIDILHVDDVAAAVISAAQSTTTGTFFLAGRSPVQWSEVFSLAASAAGRTLRVDAEVPMPLVKLGALVGDAAARITGRAGLLTSEKVKLGEPDFWVCSGDAAREQLGFAPRVELPEGIASTLAWYRENGWL